MILSGKYSSVYRLLKTRILRWIPKREKGIPSNAVVGGTDLNGNIVYIGRCRHPWIDDDYIPGYIKVNIYLT